MKQSNDEKMTLILRIECFFVVNLRQKRTNIQQTIARLSARTAAYSS